jgi:hypothetical protein
MNVHPWTLRSLISPRVTERKEDRDDRRVRGSADAETARATKGPSNGKEEKKGQDLLSGRESAAPRRAAPRRSGERRPLPSSETERPHPHESPRSGEPADTDLRKPSKRAATPVREGHRKNLEATFKTAIAFRRD